MNAQEIVIEKDNPQSGITSSMGCQISSTKKSSFSYTFGRRKSKESFSRLKRDKEYEEKVCYFDKTDLHALETPFFIKTQQVLSTQ